MNQTQKLGKTKQLKPNIMLGETYATDGTRSRPQTILPGFHGDEDSQIGGYNYTP